MKRQPPGTLAAVLSLLLAAAACAFWLLAPTVATVSGGGASTGAVGARPPGFRAESVTESTTGDGEVIVRETGVDAAGRKQVREYWRPARQVHRQTLLERESVDDAQIIGTLAFPAVLAGLALVLNATRLRTPARAVAAALLLIGSLLTGFSIGLYYLPSALAMTVAAIRGQ